MASDTLLQPEYIRAAIRTKFGSLQAFEKEHALAHKSVSDVLRGRHSKRTARAIANFLGRSISEVFPGTYESALADCSDSAKDRQHLNAGAE